MVPQMQNNWAEELKRVLREFWVISPFLDFGLELLGDMKEGFQGNFVEVRNLDLKLIPMLLFHGLDLEIKEIKGEIWGTWVFFWQSARQAPRAKFFINKRTEKYNK